MAWQFSAQQPIYLQIVDTLAFRIISGAYGRGERLPSVRELALEAAVNPNTMQRALSELERKGLVATQRTSGRTVTQDEEIIMESKKERAAQLAAAFIEQMALLGFNHAEILDVIKARTNDIGKEALDGNHA